MRSKPAGFPWHLAFFIGAAAATVYWLLLRDQKDPGVSLWVALGFGYGPAGNLTSIGNDFFSGINQVDGKSALPLVSVIVGKPLTDLAGNVLTDLAGNPLTDTTGANQNAFPSANNAQLRLTGNLSGSNPA
jgi:hypothetical protein